MRKRKTVYVRCYKLFVSQVKPEAHTTMATDVQQHAEDTGKGSVALGAGMMLVGALLGCVWAWLTFFRRSKSPRNGMTGSSGQVSIHNSSRETTICVCIILLPEAIRSLVCSRSLILCTRCYEERCWAV